MPKNRPPAIIDPPEMIDPMFRQLVHSVEIEAEMAEIFRLCAQRASCQLVVIGSPVYLAEDQLRLFYREIRKRLLPKSWDDPVRVALNMVVDGMQDNHAVSLEITVAGDRTTLLASPVSLQDGRKAFERQMERETEMREERAHEDRDRRRHGLKLA